MQEMGKLPCNTINLFFSSSGQHSSTYLSQSAVLEWRFSFSQAEILLSDALPNIPRKAFLEFKATVKRHDNLVPDFKGDYDHKIPTYVLKTILFRVVEKYNIEYWNEQDYVKTTESFFKILFHYGRNNVLHI